MPFLEKVAALAEFEVRSQVLHHVPLQRQPQECDQGHCFAAAVLPYVLPHPNTWDSDATATTQPALSFTLYVPSAEHSPLSLLRTDGEKSATNAYLLPQTGGIVFSSREDGGTTDSLSLSQAQEGMRAFVAQLRLLLGVPPPPVCEECALQYAVPAYVSGLADWELDRLLRKRALENLARTSSSLRSLSMLVEELTNMVVLDHIRHTVEDSLSAVEEAEAALARGDLPHAQEASRRAHARAQEAFFDSRMVGMLYFPDEHKFSVYTPLVLPFTLPLVSRLMSEFKRWRKKMASAA